VRYLTNLEVSDEDIRQMTVLNPARLLGNDRLAAETETAVAQAGAA
jgi:hypothetical protein